MKFVAGFLVVLLLAPAVLAEGAGKPSPEGVVERALSWIGVTYRFGSSDERRGFDCSGFVRRAFKTVGIDLPNSAAAQFRLGERVDLEDLSRGDLVFFSNTYKRGISHVGIYLGENQFVHAASRRRSVVVDALDTPYYRSHFAGGRRILEMEAPEEITPGGQDEARLVETVLFTLHH